MFIHLQRRFAIRGQRNTIIQPTTSNVVGFFMLFLTKLLSESTSKQFWFSYNNFRLSNSNFRLSYNNFRLSDNNFELSDSNYGLINNNLGLSYSNFRLLNNNYGLLNDNFRLLNNNFYFFVLLSDLLHDTIYTGN